MNSTEECVYVVQGYYPEDIVVNKLTIVCEEGSVMWVQDEDKGNYLVDISEVIPKYEDALKKAVELTDLVIKDLQEDILVQKDFKRELRLGIAKSKKRRKK